MHDAPHATTQPSVAARLFLKDGRVRPLLRVLAYTVCVFIVATVLELVTFGASVWIAHGAKPSRLYAIGVGELDVCIAVVGAALLLRRYLDRRSAASLGFGFRAPWLRLAFVGACLGAVMQLSVFAVNASLGYSNVAGYGTLSGDVVELGITVPLFVVAALAEEMPFRGYLFQNLWEEFGLWPAVALTALIFALLHLRNPNSHAQLALTIAGLVAYGVWACLSVLYTKSLWLALGAHFSWNIFEGPVLGYPVSGIALPGTTVIQQAVSGPAWFTGGPFGPEAGASSLMALFLGLALLYALHRRGAFAKFADEREPYARANA